MPKKKISRKELLKSPDEFLTFSEKVALYVGEHSKYFRMAGYGVAVALLIYLGVTTYLNYANRKGQTAYNLAYQELEKALDQKPDKRDLKKPEELFREVMEGHSLSRVSRLVPPQVAFIKFKEKKYDEAISYYHAFLRESPESPYRSLAMLAMAACYEEKGELAKSIEGLKEVASGSSSPFMEQALLELARVYRLANQNDKAKEVLQEFIEKFKNSPFIPFARASLGELKS